MHLVDRDRRAAGVGLAPEVAVGGVAPVVVELRRDDRGGGGAELGGAGEGVGLERQAGAVGADDLVLVGEAGRDVGDEDLPDAGVAAEAHGVAPAVPGVEVADDRDAAGVRRPDGEVHAVGALVAEGVGAHLVEEAQVAALADVVVVHRAEDRAEGVGVGHPPLAAGVARAVLERLALADGERALEEAGVVAALERARRLAVEGEGLELGGAVDEGARDELRRPRPARRARRRGRRAAPATIAATTAGSSGGRRRLLAPDGLLAHLAPPSRPGPCRPVVQGYRPIPQMSCAYCRIVRSDENQPMRAVLRIAFCHQAEGSDQSSSTWRWAAQ